MTAIFNDIPFELRCVILAVCALFVVFSLKKKVKEDANHPLKYLMWGFLAVSAVVMVGFFVGEFLQFPNADVISMCIVGAALVAFIADLIAVYVLSVKRGYVSYEQQKKNNEKFKALGFLFAICVVLIVVTIIVNQY